MAIDFFQKELKKTQERFNQTFGLLCLCDLRMRQAAILSICFLGNLERKIKGAVNKDKVREEIKKFMRIRNVLNSAFDQIENHIKRKGDYAKSNDQTKICANGTTRYVR